MVVLLFGSGANGLECEPAGEDFLGKHLGGAGGRCGHDVEVSGVLGQVVAQAFDFLVDRDALAGEHRAVDQLVAGHVLLHLFDHGVDGLDDPLLVGFALQQAVHGVTHD